MPLCRLVVALILMLMAPVLVQAELTQEVPSPSASPAARAAETKPFFKEIGVFLAYGATPVEAQRDYVSVPVYLRLGIDMDERGLGFSDWIAAGARVFFQSSFRPAGLTRIALEPFAAFVPSPEPNLEAGFQLVFKYEWPVSETFHPYVWNGIGGMVRTAPLREQGTLWDFTPELGMGLRFGLSGGRALDLEYRYRHFSSANLMQPNRGVNMHFVSAGITEVY